MSSMNPGNPGGVQPQAVSAKKTNPLVWILGGLAVFLLVLGGAAIIGTYFVVHKAKQAGLDPELMEKNPGLAVAKMMAAVNPHIDLVSVDDSRGLITFREKSSGKTVTVNLEDAKRGRISFRDESNKEVTMETDSATGTAQIKSNDGSMQLGGVVKLPSWVPQYPGSKPEGSYSAQGKDGDSASVHFTTKDSIEQVSRFYEIGLKSSGLKVTTTSMQQDGTPSSGMLTGQDEASGRSAIVTFGKSEDGTSVNLVVNAKR